MRILKLLFSATIFFVIIIVLGFFATREALLYWGTSKIKDSLRTLSSSESRGSFRSQCVQLGSKSIGGEDIVAYRLRFLSSKEFLLEAVCDQFSFDPILIKQVVLPQFVSKVPGTSGFILNSNQSGIELQVFSDEITKISKAIKIDLSKIIKTKSLVAQDGVIIDGVNTSFMSNGPITSCNGYGYECCQDISQIGVGDRISGLVDCEKTCYSACATRPVILSFNTNPFFDPRLRSLTISSGATVEFTYVADSGKATTIGGILDFGDGKKMPITGLAGQASHTYTCTSQESKGKSKCEYIVQLTLEDNWGVESAITNTSQVKVVVNK